MFIILNLRDNDKFPKKNGGKVKASKIEDIDFENLVFDEGAKEDNSDKKTKNLMADNGF